MVWVKRITRYNLNLLKRGFGYFLNIRTHFSFNCFTENVIEESTE
jgi:hypothetical protein